MSGDQKIYQVTVDEYDEVTADALWIVEEATEKTLDEDNEKAPKAYYTNFKTNTDILKSAQGVAIDAEETVKLTDGQYFADDVKFLWIGGDKDELEVTIKEGVQDYEGDVEYVIEEIADDDDNVLVKYVIIEKKFDNKNYTEGVVYIAESETSTKQIKTYVDPEDKDEEVRIAYGHTAYVDGVETAVVLTDKSVVKGFYVMSELVDGVYELGDADDADDDIVLDADDGVYEGLTVANLYKGKITLKDGSDNAVYEDTDITSAKIVDVREDIDDEDLITKIADITKGMTVDVVGGEEETIVIIYIV